VTLVRQEEGITIPVEEQLRRDRMKDIALLQGTEKSNRGQLI